MEAKRVIQMIIKNAGIKAEVINAGGKVIDDWPCISYVITYRKGNSELRIPYHLGVGHVDWNKSPQGGYNALNNDDQAMILVMRRSPHARPSDKAQWAATAAKLARLQKVQPDVHEALATVCRDTKEAFESSFEEWAANFGFDPDSREAERIYRGEIERYLRLLSIMNRDALDALAALACEL